MKKFLMILVAVIGFGICANAQICARTGNVEPTVDRTSSNSSTVYYSLKNTNNYKVTVKVWVIYKGEKEKSSNVDTYVIDANTTKQNPSGNNLSITHWAGGISGFNKDYLTIKLSVEKCE